MIIEKLKNQVINHSVLKTKWLVEKNKRLTKEDLILWLGQEYFVSKAFVNWFLLTAAMSSSVKSKIILVENVWEELGEGVVSQSHVEILRSFVQELGFNPDHFECFPETGEYLNQMESLIKSDYFQALGALGPANEYLLKLEYSQVSQSYQNLKEKENLPEGKFFQVNLDADEGHSKRLFELISEEAVSPEQIEKVKQGNESALNARLIFYRGLEKRTKF